MSLKVWKIYAVFISCCVSVSAEIKVPIIADIGNSGQLGYKRPDIGLSAGLESYHQNYWFHITGKFSPTDKISYGDVTQYGVNGEMFWKNRCGLFVGGGGHLRNITFHDLHESHWTYGPTVSGGWLSGGFRVVVRGYAYERDTRYDFSGVSWSVTYDLKGRLRLGSEQGFYRLRSKWSSDPKSDSAFVSAVVIGFVF